MKRIGLFLTASPRGGGMYQYSASILSALLILPRSDYTLVVAFTDPAWERHLPTNVKRVPVHLSRTFRAIAGLWVLLGLSHRFWLRHVTSISSAVREIVKQNCDLWIFPRQDLWSSRFPVPTFAAIHDLMHRYEPQFSESAGFGRRRYRDTYMRDLTRHSVGILAESNVGAQHIRESYGADPGKLFVLPYIPPPYLLEGNMTKDFDAKYRLPDKFLFYPAQFWPHKNHARLVQALARALASGADIHLVLTGDERNEYRSIRMLVHKLQLGQHVHFAGCVPEQDIAEFYRRARALIYPTLYGPTNIPPIEAFVLGCPVAVSGIYAMPELLGDAALLFDPRSEEQLTDSMLHLWNDDLLCRHLSVAGRERAQTWGYSQFAASLHCVLETVTSPTITSRSGTGEALSVATS